MPISKSDAPSSFASTGMKIIDDDIAEWVRNWMKLGFMEMGIG